MPHQIETPSEHAGTKRRNIVPCAIVAFAILFPAPAFAHDESGVVGGFVSGFLHPLSGFDHALAMIAVGLWGAILGRPLVAVLPVVFPLTMAFGGALGVAQLPIPPVELGIAVSVITLGVLVALSVRAHIIVACAVVAAFAIFHGYAHGQEAPSVADPVGYSAGFVFSTGLLHLVGIAIGALRPLPNGAAAVRAGGGLIAISGLWFAWKAVVG